MENVKKNSDGQMCDCYASVQNAYRYLHKAMHQKKSNSTDFGTAGLLKAQCETVWSAS